MLNPFYRLRNDPDGVVVYGMEGVGEYKIHHAYGIVLSLFDGHRTVGDVVEAVLPFVNASSRADARDEARAKVGCIVAHFLKSPEEQLGTDPARSDLPSTAALIPVSRLSDFPSVRSRCYDPTRLLPLYAPRPTRITGSGRSRAPYRINWHLTASCSTDCRYCYLGRREIPLAALLPFSRVLEIVHECLETGVFEISPGGGDVLLYPHLVEFLSALSAGDFLPVRLCTKSHLSAQMAQDLARSGMVHDLQFSIDSTVEDVADYLTRTPGFCRRTLESIDNALQAGLPVSTKSVITPYNVLTIPRLYRELRTRGVRIVRLALYARSAYHHTDDLFMHEESFAWLEEAKKDLQREFPDDFINIQNGAPQPMPFSREEKLSMWKGRSRCTAGRTGLMICADGKVIPCEQMPEIDEVFCGDLCKQSLQEVWESDALLERTVTFRRDQFSGTPCFSCDEFDDCLRERGICIRDVAALHKTIYRTPEGCPKSEDAFLRMM